MARDYVTAEFVAIAGAVEITGRSPSEIRAAAARGEIRMEQTAGRKRVTTRYCRYDLMRFAGYID